MLVNKSVHVRSLCIS